jgi:hypothetical protein
MPSERTQALPRVAGQRDCGNLLRSVRDFLFAPTEYPSIRHGVPRQTLSIQFFRENLSHSQRLQYETCGYFDVVGGDTGRRYRIWHGSLMNVKRLSEKGVPIKLCFMPRGPLPIGDVMLAQKFALELFESEAVAIAKKSLASLPCWFGPIG